MEFYQLLLNRLELIFQKHKLHVIEQFNNYVKLKSDRLTITLCHNVRENYNAFYIGRNEKFMYQINDCILKSIFNSDLKISNEKREDFINNLAVFFEGEGKLLISGNANTLEKIEKYVYKEGEFYTKQLIEKQNLDAANRAWEERNYIDFIKYLDKTERQELPYSYELKYKMALEKLK